MPKSKNTPNRGYDPRLLPSGHCFCMYEPYERSDVLELKQDYVYAFLDEGNQRKLVPHSVNQVPELKEYMMSAFDDDESDPVDNNDGKQQQQQQEQEQEQPSPGIEYFNTMPKKLKS
ncbi:hypothetical protein INT47_012228 [Mucor saturninus]|uniref:Uncharacterized protein n=1 Tax=Mucor saturninus TaxID=64648 RepID=A0A8H7RAZ7_9FUNG|nr:hypothetical protein INT47_012228 [Mucor saturninus]